MSRHAPALAGAAAALSPAWLRHGRPAGEATYRPDVDGLRAVAVLAVVIHHLGARWLPGGFVGVDVFFVISGYLITRLIAADLERGEFSFARFYERRARRIFPALFAVVGATLAAAWLVLLPGDLLGVLRAAIGAMLFAANLVFWRMSSGYFDQLDAASHPLLHTWSLGVEEQFYVFYPVFLLLAWRWARGSLTLLVAAGALVSFAGAALLVHSNASAAFYLAPLRGWELLAGALLALGAVPRVASAGARELLAAAGIAAILAACLLFDERVPFPGLSALLPVAGAAAVIHAGASGPTRLGRLLATGPMVAVGLISYSLYLWHWPVIVMARHLDPLAAPTPARSLLLLAISMALAAASYRWIERPFRRPRPATPPGRGFGHATLGAATAAAILLFCAAGLWAAGFPSRFSPEVVALDAARRPADIPFMACSDRAPDDACRVGSASAQADTLLWGDSHLIAWGPALDRLLAEGGRGAVLATATGCAPLIGVASRMKPACDRFNEGMRAWLERQPAIRTVVLSAFWSTYLREGGPLSAAPGAGARLQGAAAAAAGLQSTVRWLLASGREVVILGPVPVYPEDVPATLALEAARGRPLLDRSAQAQRERHRWYADAVAALPRHERLRILEPMAWLCADECRVMQDGTPLYRDDHHLSLAGALALSGPLREGLGLGRPVAPGPATQATRPAPACAAGACER